MFIIVSFQFIMRALRSANPYISIRIIGFSHFIEKLCSIAVESISVSHSLLHSANPLFLLHFIIPFFVIPPLSPLLLFLLIFYFFMNYHLFHQLQCLYYFILKACFHFIFICFTNFIFIIFIRIVIIKSVFVSVNYFKSSYEYCHCYHHYHLLYS